MTKEDYIKLLDLHDWTYEFSDDHRWYKKGKAEADRLKALAASNDEFKELYSQRYMGVFGEQCLSRPI